MRIEDSWAERFYIKPGYRSRDRPAYYDDTWLDPNCVNYQPSVYPLAAALGGRLSCKYVIDIGCGAAHKLAALHPTFELIGVDIGSNLKYCIAQYPFGTWIEADLERPKAVELPVEIIRQAVIICADVIEHLIDPIPLLELLRKWMDYSPVCLVSTPERDLLSGADDVGPPGNPSHVREWTLSEFKQLLLSRDLNVAWVGLTPTNDRTWELATSLAVIRQTPTHDKSKLRKPLKKRTKSRKTAKETR